MLRETPGKIDGAKQTLPFEAIPADRQPPLRLLCTNLHTTIFCESRFKLDVILPRNVRFQSALSNNNILTSCQANRHQTIFESLEGSCAQLKQATSLGPDLSTPVSSPKLFSQT